MPNFEQPNVSPEEDKKAQGMMDDKQKAESSLREEDYMKLSPEDQ